MTPADIDARHKGWHAWQSRTDDPGQPGRWCATSTVSPMGGSGQTVDAGTLEELDTLLAAGEGR